MGASRKRELQEKPKADAAGKRKAKSKLAGGLRAKLQITRDGKSVSALARAEADSATDKSAHPVDGVGDLAAYASDSDDTNDRSDPEDSGDEEEEEEEEEELPDRLVTSKRPRIVQALLAT